MIQDSTAQNNVYLKLSSHLFDHLLLAMFHRWQIVKIL